MDVWLTGGVAIAFTLIHLYGCRLKVLDITPRSSWLSASSGISVAYVFIHILPDLSKAQEDLQSSTTLLGFLEHHVYVAALIGMVIFYGLERLAKKSREKNIAEGDGDVTELGVFSLHMLSFTAYNLLIGYLLLHQEESNVASLILYAIAIGTHLLVNDYGLHSNHKGAYRKVGRWILAAAIITGWVIGTQLAISEAALAVVFALLAGSIILNVLKEELPEERQSRFWIFALGTASYAAILLAV
ncbi:MAG: hypothetical protein AAGI69_05570 [Cyanobacteria bacterium P01_H01_bin.21]